MKLYNRTTIADNILIDALVKAGRSVGANTSGVVVQVNPARSLAVRGVAYECGWIKWSSKREMKTDGGYFSISLPTCKRWQKDGVWYQWGDPLKIAAEFVRVARHEWGHIRDFQHGGRWSMEFAKRGASGRRQRHDSRPEEVRANDYIYDSDQRLKPEHFDDVILALAIAIERTE